MARQYDKYDDAHPPLQCFMHNSTWYKGSTEKFVPLGFLIHDTGCDNDTVRRYVQPDDDAPNRDELLQIIGKNRNGNDWNHTSKQAGLNCWIGRLANGKVATVQAGPWTKRPWGCGSQKKNGVYYSLNDTHIQWEICEDAKKDKAYFGDCYQEMIQLMAYLAKKFNINPHGTIKYRGITVPTIVCHWDSYKLGCGSGHFDIYDWTVMYEYLGIPKSSVNTNDPNNKIMQRIRDDVAKAMGDQPQPTPEPKTLDGYTVGKSYQVLTADGLNVRTAATTSSTIVSALKKGTDFECKALTHDDAGNTWMRIEQPVAGWVACIYKGLKYVGPIGWYKEGHKWYYIDGAGDQYKNQWLKYKNKWYYLGADGAMVTGWQTIKKKDYYFYDGENDGHMASAEWIDTRWLEKTGEQTYPYRGEWKKDAKGKYFQDESGWYAKNCTQKIDKKTYTFNKKGYLVE